MILAHLRSSLRETFPARASEWALATILLNWSTILYLNPTLFATVPSFSIISEIAPQPVWLALCGLAGGARLVILLINGAWRRSPHARAVGAFVSCFFWFEISVGLFLAGTWGTGLAVYPVLLLLDSFNVLRAGGEAGLSDDKHKRAAHHEQPGS